MEEVRLASDKKFKLFLARTGYDSSLPPQSITSHSLFTGIHVGGTRRSDIGHCEPSCRICKDHTLEFVDGLCMHVERAAVFIEHSPLVLPHTSSCPSCCFYLPLCFLFYASARVFVTRQCMQVDMQSVPKSQNILVSFRRSQTQLLIKNPHLHFKINS